MSSNRPYPARSTPLPLTRDGVTTEWLTKMLQYRYPKAVVEQMDVVGVHAGHTTKLRVKWRLNEAGAGLDEKPEIVVSLSMMPASLMPKSSLLVIMPGTPSIRMRCPFWGGPFVVLERPFGRLRFPIPL